MSETKISQNVKLAVQIAGTQKELARLAGITQGAVSKYCRQACVPSGVTARRLSNAVSGKLKPADFAPHIFGDLDGQ